MIVRSNALALPLRDACVDLIVTSPPYFALRSYRDGDEHFAGQLGSEETPGAFVDALIEATREMVRVLKPTGSIFVNLGDKYAGSGGHNNNGLGSSTLGHHKGGGGPHAERMRPIEASRRNAPDRYNQNSGGIPAKSLMGLPWRYAIGCIDQLGLILRAEVIWSKPNGLPESVTDRVRRSHEQWFHLVKQGRYFSAVDEIREAHVRLWDDKNGGSFSSGLRDVVDSDNPEAGNLVLRSERPYPKPNPLGKLPGSVWTIPSEPLTIPEWAREKHNLPDHFAAFPQEWPRRIILGWSPSGICTKCSEGRRPMVEKDRRNTRPLLDTHALHGAHDSDDRRGFSRGETDATISGYVCACTPYADHPERRGTSFLNQAEAAESGASTNGVERNKAYREGRAGPTGPVREYHIVGWEAPPTRPAVVLDPFAGTGTVAMVARALGRTGLSFDLSGDYGRLARWRIYESGHAAKSEDRTWRDAQGAML